MSDGAAPLNRGTLWVGRYTPDNSFVPFALDWFEEATTDPASAEP
jgi:hypothetical protein